MRLALKLFSLPSLLVFGKFAQFEGFLLAFAQPIRLTGFWNGIVQCAFRLFCRHTQDSRHPRDPSVSGFSVGVPHGQPSMERKFPDPKCEMLRIQKVFLLL